MQAKKTGVFVAALGLMFGVASCGSDAEPFPAGEPVDLVYFSDSGGWGVAERYGRLASEALDREVRVHDHAIGGLSAVRVLDMVQNSLADEVAEAEIVVVYGNPEGSEADFAQPDIGTCVSTSTAERQPPVVATMADWQPYRDVLDGIYAEIWSLREGQPTIIRAVDLYSPVISDWRAAGIEAECTASWEVWSSVIGEAAEANGATFVSVYDLLNGENHDEDPRGKGLIGGDGEHTTDDGAALIADALAAAGFELSKPAG
jgi:hypothetical protein